MTVKSQYNLGPNPLKHNVVAIGNWDMVATASVDIDVGIAFTRWRNVGVTILDDTSDILLDLVIDGDDSGYWEHTAGKGATIMTLYRNVLGRYNDVAYDEAVFERGNISLGYD